MKKDDYSGRVWDRYNTFDKWRGFMRHDYVSASRYLAYYLISRMMHASDEKPLTFAEIGFGNARDFQVCFCVMEQHGWIDYIGYEIVEHFVRFARLCWGEARFRIGGFLDLKPDSYDVTYTRHTLEMIAPKFFGPSLRRLLRATKKVCIIVFHKPPQEREDVGFQGGGWMNTYDVATVRRIIEEEGFSLNCQADVIYWMERLPAQ